MNYNTILESTLSCVGLQIVTGIFLVCFTALMHVSLFKCRALMRDVHMDGLYDISCKWCFILFYCCVCSPSSRVILWLLFLSDDFCGVWCDHLLLMIWPLSLDMFALGSNVYWAATVLLTWFYCTYFGQSIVTWLWRVFLLIVNPF